MKCNIFVDIFAAPRKNNCITISTVKDEMLYQSIPGIEENKPSITINGHRLKTVESFAYLRNTLHKAVHIDNEVILWVAKVCVAYSKLKSLAWNMRGIILTTKLKVYASCVLPTHLYAYEPWAVYSQFSSYGLF